MLSNCRRYAVPRTRDYQVSALPRGTCSTQIENYCPMSKGITELERWVVSKYILTVLVRNISV